MAQVTTAQNFEKKKLFSACCIVHDLWLFQSAPPPPPPPPPPLKIYTSHTTYCGCCAVGWNREGLMLSFKHPPLSSQPFHLTTMWVMCSHTKNNSRTHENKIHERRKEKDKKMIKRNKLVNMTMGCYIYTKANIYVTMSCNSLKKRE